MIIRRRLIARLLVGWYASLVASSLAHAVEPLAQAHSHNDYWRERPLLDALDHGFTSVEADIFLVDGELLVGHARGELQPRKTLEKLYLAPLAQRVRDNGGRVHPGTDRFLLLIDIKSDAQTTYTVLNSVLARYVEILTTIERGQVRPGAVTVVISGNRPAASDLARADVRYAGLDGRPADLDSEVPAHLMPMISDSWLSQFTWNGSGAMPASERSKLQDITRRAHAAGRVVRFWATPENETVWRELQSAGVDLINTDQLARLATFLRTPPDPLPKP